MLLFEYTNISYDTDLLIRLSKALESVIRSDKKRGAVRI